MAQSVNQQVIIWARGHQGKQVDRGECWDLANRALRNASGKNSADFGPVAEDDDYVWGDEVALKDVIPGDILQFRDFSVTTETVTEKSFSDGSSETDSEEVTVERPHHTALVDAVVGPGRLQILEQNVQPLGKRVQRHLLFTRDVQGVPTTERKTVRVGSGKWVPAVIVKTVTVTVSGTIWAYRPEAR